MITFSLIFFLVAIGMGISVVVRIMNNTKSPSQNDDLLDKDLD